MKSGRKPGSFVRGTCCLCGTVELVRGTTSHFRCTACIQAGHFNPSTMRGDWLGKESASARVQSEIRNGNLPNPKTLTCDDCGGPAIEYEHRDYNKPLMVVPICRSCNLRRGPAVPLNGSVKKLIDNGLVPYRLNRNAFRVLRLMGLPTDALNKMPVTLTHAHWVELLPLFEQQTEAA